MCTTIASIFQRLGWELQHLQEARFNCYSNLLQVLKRVAMVLATVLIHRVASGDGHRQVRKCVLQRLAADVCIGQGLALMSQPRCQVIILSRA